MAEKRDMEATYDKMPAAEQSSEDGRSYKEYEHGGHMFKVFKPDNDRMAVELVGGGTGLVSVDTERRTYLYRTPGVIAYDAVSAKAAFENVVNVLSKTAGQPPVDQLRKGLEDLYDELPKTD